MGIRLLVPKETMAGEARVALIPDIVGKLVKAGFEISIESGAGEKASYADEIFRDAGGVIVGKEATFKAQVILTVQCPSKQEIELMAPGAILVGFLSPHQHKESVVSLRDKKITSFAMELIPRISRAQSMDALSSQATVAGYKAALLAANLSHRFFPMLTTAAGTIRPVKVLVIGAGVAGLMAIATARRLGAVVEAYDVRRTVKEQVESLGARFVETPMDAETQGGYARELSEEEKIRQRELVSRHISRADVVITTAHVPSLKAPRIISKEMVSGMRAGSVIIDLAAESGGNCALTVPGEVVQKNGVTIHGPLNLPSGLPIHASEMYAKNVYNFLMLLTHDGKSLELDFNDPIISGSILTQGGTIKNELARKAVEGGAS